MSHLVTLRKQCHILPNAASGSSRLRWSYVSTATRNPEKHDKSQILRSTRTPSCNSAATMPRQKRNVDPMKFLVCILSFFLMKVALHDVDRFAFGTSFMPNISDLTFCRR
ncbi:putative transmembrane protein [Toxoplasma gondii RUB]|uniref:Putative transmembrane protein n=8 Tax=Toxoplasma gondii TaxID=5811 RepID=S7UV64_TOXGG|nr:putative transmembrane protein [Toxoplasma gondii GT1]KFG41153.1 putative transmembrane protein [Toxoplasma gondii GAB2-2007-GAL-DOM2]KFG45296.1 putative transmembrane protein [Toxoplasma gondii p89]KFG53543.1 putative transmembrane protein [Toxoplasma gondii FOU]KFG62083.1 putative transmembrane protein [Toxoplasma gondii RUB]KFH06891.1 putative transmembrane protein [Toxoplasma gondii VAND]PUA83312.1 putative transmembrane protein [Toxoplasma gondii TgCATBr9]RQX73402.1 putative transmem